MAAEQGVTQAQFNLAYYYEYGQGVPQNLSEATKWYKAAAKQGHTEAKDRLKKLKQAK